jgi:hypothetical protein
MKINLTLLIQIIHFILTWKMLKIFILKPVYDQLEKRAKKEKEYLDALALREKFIAQQKELQKKELLEFQAHTSLDYPLPEKPSIDFEFNTSYTRDDKEIQTLTEKIKNLIVQKVPRVRS